MDLNRQANEARLLLLLILLRLVALQTFNTKTKFY